MNLIEHAKSEFIAAKWLTPDGMYIDEMQEMVCEHILKLLKVFSDEGHSGTSAPYALNVFNRLAHFKPIAPITGEDSEWNEVSDGRDGIMYQNKRMSSVFKDDSGAWDIDGRVFWEWQRREDGSAYKSYYTCKDSHLPITFPYTPGDRIEEYRYSDATPLAPPQTEQGLL